MNTYSYLETDTSVSEHKFIHIKNAAYKQTFSVCSQAAFIISLRLNHSYLKTMGIKIRRRVEGISYDFSKKKKKNNIT